MRPERNVMDHFFLVKKVKQLVKVSENPFKDHYKRKTVREKHQESIGAVHESIVDNPEAAYHFRVLHRELAALLSICLTPTSIEET